MADQPKKKNAALRSTNDSRPNKKASKLTSDMFKGTKGLFRGSHTRGVTLTEVQKVSMGHGALDRYRPLTKDEADVYFETHRKRGA